MSCAFLIGFFSYVYIWVSFSIETLYFVISCFLFLFFPVGGGFLVGDMVKYIWLLFYFFCFLSPCLIFGSLSDFRYPSFLWYLTLLYMCVRPYSLFLLCLPIYGGCSSLHHGSMFLYPWLLVGNSSQPHYIQVTWGVSTTCY